MNKQTRNTEVQINEEEITWKRIQNYSNKDEQKPQKQNRKNARIN